jgi:hypothetical protein
MVYVVFLWREFRMYWHFGSKILLICWTELLQTSHVLHAELSLDISWGSRYIEWNLHNHNVNLSALLSDYTHCWAMWSLIQCLWSEGVRPSEIHIRMYNAEKTVLHKGRCTMVGKVPEWQRKCCWWLFDHFTNGRQCWMSKWSGWRGWTDYCQFVHQL